MPGLIYCHWIRPQLLPNLGLSYHCRSIHTIELYTDVFSITPYSTSLHKILLPTLLPIDEQERLESPDPALPPASKNPPTCLGPLSLPDNLGSWTNSKFTLLAR